MDTVVVRPLARGDSLEAITALLHRAYARLAAMGLNFTAVDQTVATTRDRFAAGQGFVAECEGAIVGCVVVAGPFDPVRHPGVLRSAWYLRHDLAHLHQLAVDPAHQGHRIGDRLIAACEAWAHRHGFRAIALDTAEPAWHLRTRYARLGYDEVDRVQWDGKRYCSLILVKPLSGPTPSADDEAHQAAVALAHTASPCTTTPT